MHRPFDNSYEHYGHSGAPIHIVPPNILGNRHINPHHIHLSQDLNQVAHQLLLVDSRDRLNSTHSQSNQFEIRLENTIKSVRSLEVLYVHAPFSEYIVHEGNNQICFRETLNPDQLTRATIPVGDYEINELLTLIGQQMTAASLVGNIYQLSFQVATQTVTIQSGNQSGLNIFQLLWDKCPGMARLLGFPIKPSTGSLTYQGPYRYQLCPYDYISVHVSGLAQNSHQLVTSPNKMVDKAMFVLWDQKNHGLNDLNLRYVKEYNPPIDLDRIRVEFRTPQGQLYNFRGQEVQILFKMELTYNYQKIRHNNQL